MSISGSILVAVVSSCPPSRGGVSQDDPSDYSLGCNEDENRLPKSWLEASEGMSFE